MTIEITSMKITDRALGTVGNNPSGLSSKETIVAAGATSISVQARTRLRRDKYGKGEKTDRYGS